MAHGAFDHVNEVFEKAYTGNVRLESRTGADSISYTLFNGLTLVARCQVPLSESGQFTENLERELNRPASVETRMRRAKRLFGEGRGEPPTIRVGEAELVQVTSLPASVLKRLAESETASEDDIQDPADYAEKASVLNYEERLRLLGFKPTTGSAYEKTTGTINIRVCPRGPEHFYVQFRDAKILADGRYIGPAETGAANITAWSLEDNIAFWDGLIETGHLYSDAGKVKYRSSVHTVTESDDDIPDVPVEDADDLSHYVNELTEPFGYVEVPGEIFPWKNTFKGELLDHTGRADERNAAAAARSYNRLWQTSPTFRPNSLESVEVWYQKGTGVYKEWSPHYQPPRPWGRRRSRRYESADSEAVEITADDITAAAEEAEPPASPEQAEAGNYKKGHVELFGLDITIENPKGSTRSGVDGNGKKWSVTMPAHYGYIKGTTGKDGDHVDVYIGGNPESKTVWVVDQLDAETGKFDEHKCMLAFSSKEDAKKTYLKGFSDGKGKDRFGGFAEMSVEEFATWARTPATKKPAVESRRVVLAVVKQLLADSAQAQREPGSVGLTGIRSAPRMLGEALDLMGVSYWRDGVPAEFTESVLSINEATGTTTVAGYTFNLPAAQLNESADDDFDAQDYIDNALDLGYFLKTLGFTRESNGSWYYQVPGKPVFVLAEGSTTAGYRVSVHRDVHGGRTETIGSFYLHSRDTEVLMEAFARLIEILEVARQSNDISDPEFTVVRDDLFSEEEEEEDVNESFRRPENWDKVDEGTGWVMYVGGNDWEDSETAAWVIFPSDEANRRIYFTIKFPADANGYESKDHEHKLKCRDHAKKAWKAWIRAAKAAHANRNRGSRSWKDAFKAALYSKEMAEYVKDRGEEQTKWSEISESVFRSVRTATRQLKARYSLMCKIAAVNENSEINPEDSSQDQLSDDLEWAREILADDPTLSVGRIMQYCLGIEIEGLQDDGEDITRVTDQDGAQFYGVYFRFDADRMYADGVDIQPTVHVEDFNTYDEAVEYAKKVGKQYNLSIEDNYHHYDLSESRRSASGDGDSRDDLSSWLNTTLPDVVPVGLTREQLDNLFRLELDRYDDGSGYTIEAVLFEDDPEDEESHDMVYATVADFATYEEALKAAQALSATYGIDVYDRDKEKYAVAIKRVQGYATESKDAPKCSAYADDARAVLKPTDSGWVTCLERMTTTGPVTEAIQCFKTRDLAERDYENRCCALGVA